MATGNEIFRIQGSIWLEDTDFLKALKNALAQAENTSTKLSQKFQSIGTTFEKVGQVATKAGKVATATLTAGISALITKGVQYNAQMEQYKIAFTTMTGSAEEAERIMQQIQEDAAKTPFDVAGLTQANQLLISTGLSADSSRETILALGNAVSATGGGNDELSRMAINLQQIKNTGKATALDIKQFAYAGIDIYGLLADYTGKTRAEVAEMDVTWDLLNNALIKASKEGGRYFNAMNAQSTTANGRISTLKDNFSAMLGIITQDLMPIFGKAIDKVNELVEKFMNLNEEQRKNVLKWGLILASVGPVLLIFGKLNTGIGKLLITFSKLASNKNVIAIFTKLKGAIKALTVALGGVSATVGIVVGVIAILGSAFYALYKNWDKVVDIAKEFAKRIDLQGKLDKLKKKIQPLIDKLKELHIDLSGVGKIFEFIGKIVVAIMIPTIAQVTSILMGLLDALSPLIDAIKSLWDICKGWTTFLSGVFTLNLEKAKQGLKDMGSGFIGVFKNLGLAIKEFITGFGESFNAFFGTLFDKMGITAWWNKVKAWFKEKKDALLGILNNWKTAIVKWFNNKKDTLVEGFEKWWTGVKSWFAEKKEKVVEKFNEIKNTVERVMNEPDFLIELLNTWTEGLNSWSTSKIEEFIQKFEDWKDRAKQWFEEKRTTISDGIETWLENAKNWIDTKKEEIPKKLEAWKESIKQWFIDKGNALVDGATEWWNNLSNWFTTTKEELPTKFEEWKEKIKTWFKEKRDALIEGFKEWFDGLKEWLTTDTSAGDAGKNMAEKTESAWEQKMKEPGFIQKLGDAILKFLGAVMLAVGVSLFSVVYSLAVHIWNAWKKAEKWLKQKFEEWFNKFKEKAKTKLKELVQVAVDKFNELKEKAIQKAGELANNAVNKFNELKTKAGDKFNELKTKTVNALTDLKNKAGEKINEAKNIVFEKVTDLKNKALGKFNELKSNTSSRFNEIRTNISNAIENARTAVVNKVTQMKTGVSNIITNIKSAITTKFNEIKNKIVSPIKEAVEKVKSYITQIKTAFSNITTKIKTPHFSIKNASLNPKDWITNGAPKIAVEWYAKAMDKGIIMDKPTAFGINNQGQIMAGGEAGSETIVGTNSLVNMIQSAVATQNKELTAKLEVLIGILSRYLPELTERELVLDSGEVVGALTNKMDSALGDLSVKRGRGR